MHQVDLGPVDFAPGLNITLPEGICANCGAKEGLEVHDQDTKKTNFFIFGGSEITFNLPISSCASCKKSLRRRPKSWFARALTSLILGAIIFTVLLMIATLGGGLGAMEQYISYIGAAVAAVTFVALTIIQRPQPGQSSYFQPVRIVGLKRRFKDGRIEQIKFQFTNPDYQESFLGINEEVLSNGLVAVKGVA